MVTYTYKKVITRGRLMGISTECTTQFVTAKRANTFKSQIVDKQASLGYTIKDFKPA